LKAVLIQKMKKVFCLCILACFGLVLCGGTALAEDIHQLMVDDAENHLMRPKAFTLHNASEGDISFFLGQDVKSLSQYQVGANNVQEFSDGRSSEYIISIPTARRGAVQYIIKSGKRYQIYWNEPSARWDLVELSNR
jgi:hypothetical protein